MKDEVLQRHGLVERDGDQKLLVSIAFQVRRMIWRKEIREGMTCRLLVEAEAARLVDQSIDVFSGHCQSQFSLQCYVIARFVF